MRLLFVKELLAWPRISGHHVHTYHLLRELGRLGHALALVTNVQLDQRAVEGIPQLRQFCFDGMDPEPGPAGDRLTFLQKFFHSRWSIDQRYGRALRQFVDEFRPDVVVAIGTKELCYLHMLEGPVRVWYPADDPIRHYLLQVFQRGGWSHLREAVGHAFFERAFRLHVDRVWVVTKAERRASRWLGGMPVVDVIPNGVDSDYYQPAGEPSLERSCVFWGRLDFAPNIEALQWFCRKVWPPLRRLVPDASFTIYGFKPTAAVESLAGRDGIRLTPNLPDLRPEVGRHQVVVLPFVSGGGIKNKLLEAASMAKAIVCSSRAASGVCHWRKAPLVFARTPRQWTKALLSLWAQPELRHRLGQSARQWVIEHHNWRTTAQRAIASIEPLLRNGCISCRNS
jgi:polysaccharide biosynthesis protein PslH